uniref:Uncharacterized protein n=1 Tax=Tanacetum cinerariifolium TaxID=118510 RepID=A0A6L2LXL2_TANCI|nr:hypothetical protein [Tanacetum cinerariifolium]
MTVPSLPKEPTKKSKRVKRPTKKSTNAPIVGVVIIDTPGVSVSKKKAPGDSEDNNESDDNEDSKNDDDDDGNDAQDSERTNLDEEENPNLNLNTEGLKQSSFVSSDFACKFLILDNVLPVINEVASMMNVKILPKEVSDFATPVIQSAINESFENVILAKSSSQPKSAYEVATSLTEFELKKILLDKIEKKEPEFKVTDFDMPHNQEGNLGNDDKETMRDVAFKCGWFTKPKKPQKPTDPDWNHGYSKDSRRSSTGSQKLPEEDQHHRPETTRPDIRKRDPYTLHIDPRGFIYVDNQRRNKMMRLDKLYKFSDGTLQGFKLRLKTSQRISKWSTCHKEDGVP